MVKIEPPVFATLNETCTLPILYRSSKSYKSPPPRPQSDAAFWTSSLRSKRLQSRFPLRWRGFKFDALTRVNRYPRSEACGILVLTGQGKGYW